MSDPPPGFGFLPRPDITAADLAALLRHLGLTIDGTVYGRLPPGLQRHFTRLDEVPSDPPE
jgi:hypothetical protein